MYICKLIVNTLKRVLHLNSSHIYSVCVCARTYKYPQVLFYLSSNTTLLMASHSGMHFKNVD